MQFKQALSSVLVVSLLAPMIAHSSRAEAQAAPLPGGQAADGYSISASGDSIDLILQAIHAKSADEARRLIEQAKQKVAFENLPPQTLAQVNAVLVLASQRVAQSNYAMVVVNQPISFTIDDKTAPAKSTSAAKTQDEITAELFERQPELRESMREISRGRTERDASHLDAIIKQETNKTVQQLDAENGANEMALADAGEFVAALRSMHVIHDYANENKALRLKHSSMSVDQLAAQIIGNQIEWSAALGTVKKMISSSGLSYKREFAGVSVEALGNFVLNANLVLRLADLYNVELDQSQQDVLIVSVFMGAKFAHFFVKQNQLVQETAGKMGDLFASAKLSKQPHAMARFVKLVLGSRLMKATTASIPGGAGLPAAAGQAIGTTGAAAIGSLERAQAAATSAEAAAAKGAVGEKAAALSWRWQIFNAVRGAVQSGAETYAIGHFTVWMLRREKRAERKLETEEFRSFLMSNKGEGFIKLLILAMNTGRDLPNVVDVKSTHDPKANFILNLARSTKVCSPSDLQRFNTLTAQAKAKQPPQVLSERDYKILRFACDSKLSQGRYQRMSREFLSFNSVPQRLLDLLRTAPYDDRLRMGEVLMQLQFLDGDQDDKEGEFFDTTISKILGLNRAEDSNYFDRFHAFIREQGGMVTDIASPTGFSIGAMAVENPYDTSSGYTVAGGPDSPNAPVIAPVVQIPAAPAIVGGVAGPAPVERR